MKLVNLIIIGLTLSIPSFIMAKDEVKAIKDGFYVKEMKVADGVGFNYLVDTKTKVCFAQVFGNGTLTVIDCDLLANREEWKPIITWVK